MFISTNHKIHKLLIDVKNQKALMIAHQGFFLSFKLISHYKDKPNFLNSLLTTDLGRGMYPSFSTMY